MIADDDLHPDLMEIDALISQGFAEAEQRSVAGLVPDDAIVVAGPRGAPGRTTVAAALCLVHSTRGDTIAVDLDPYEPGLGDVIAQQTAFELPAVDGDNLKGAGETTVVDLGLVPGSSPLLRHRGPLLAVIEGTERGLGEAIDWFAEWAGEVPLLLVNRTVDPDIIRTEVRNRIGLEPIMVIPELVDPVPDIASRLSALDFGALRSDRAG